MRLSLRRWQQPQGGSWRPGEQALGLAVNEPSLAFSEMACALCLNANSSFLREAKLMNKLGMGPVSWEKLRHVVEAQGQSVSESQRQQSFALRWQASGCADASRQGSLVCVGVDGVMTRQVTDSEKRKRRRRIAGKRGARAKAGKKLHRLPKRKPGADGPWKEVKIVGAYQHKHVHRHWRSTTQNHLMASVLMTQVARRVGLSKAQVKIAVVDGAEWIKGRLDDCLPDLTAIILDFYHLSEHVYTAVNRAFGEGTDQARQCADRLLTAIRHKGFEAFDTLLVECLNASSTSSDGRVGFKDLRQYVTQRQAMVDYPFFESQGWPIGSGPTESMAGVLTSRIKGRGRRWDACHIDAVMALEALEVNGEWAAYWQAQKRKPIKRWAA